MKRRVRARAGDGRAQAAVEFVLVLPVFFVLIFGIVEFGITYNHWVTLSDAVRAGVRQAAVCRFAQPGDKSVLQTVKDAAVDLPDKDTKLAVHGTGVDLSCPLKSGDEVNVNAQYPYSINIMGLVVKSGDLNSTITQQAE